jgi:hypothetical protein
MASENCTNRDLPHDGKLNVLKVIYELIFREKKYTKYFMLIQINIYIL